MEPETHPDLPPVEFGDEATPSVTPSPEVARMRAQKADIGGLTHATGLDYNKLYAEIANGKEPEFRQVAATTLNFQAAMKQENAILDAYRKKGAPLTQQEALNVVNPFNAGNKPANPDDVIERAYATNSVSSLNTADTYMRDTVISKAEKEIPEQLQQKQDAGTDAITKIEYAKTLRDDIDQQISQQGWVPWAIDQAKTMFQPYNEWKLRGNDPNVGLISGGLLLGDNLKAQTDDIWDMPTDKAVASLKEIVGNLAKDNPTVAKQFLNYFIGQSEYTRKMDNVFSILAPSDYATGFKIGKDLLKKIIINNRAGTAVKQMVEAAAKPDNLNIPLKAVLQEAAGDVKGGAATRAADHTVDVVNGKLDPVQDVKESLTSGFRLDGDLFDTNPGNLTREDLTRYKDSFYNAGDRLYNVIQTVLRVNRTPVPLRNEDAIRAYLDAERTRYRGLENAILDIHSPFHMSETNTYWVQHDFGNENGRLFSDPETAQNWARQHGFADPRIQEATGVVERVPAGERGSQRDFRRRRQLQEGIEYNEATLKNSQDFLKKQGGRRFVGPVQPEAMSAAQSNVENIPDALDRMRAELERVQARIVKTDPVIEQNGVGYKVSILRPYKEDDDVVRQWLINDAKARSTNSLTNWDSWKNSWLGWVRSADDTLAYNESVNRKIANYTQAQLRRWAKDEAHSIEQVANRFKWYKPQTWLKAIGNKQMFEEFNATLKHAKDMRDPNTRELGYFFKTPGELQDHYTRFFQRPVTPAEMQAYFAHVRILEANRVLSEIAEFRNRARIGAEQHQVFFLDGAKRLGSGFFDAIHQKEFPGGSDQILIVGGHKGDERLARVNEISLTDKAKYRDALDKGQLKLLRIYDPDSRPLKGWSNVGDHRIRYVLTSDSESKPLAFNHINRRGGGHYDVDSDWYVKQANMVTDTHGDAALDKRKSFKKTYVGDRTFSAAENRVMGHDIATKMTRMNQLIKDNNLEEAQNLARHLGMEWEEVQSWYRPKVAANGHVIGLPDIDIDEPFYVVPRNKKIFDIDKSLEERHGLNFEDGSKTGSDALQFRVEYSQARDSENLHKFINSGTQGNPIYRFVPATYVDPIPSLNRAINRAISSTFMDDYKIHAIEHWVSEALPYLKATESEVRSAPFWHFNNADKGAFKPASDMDRPGLVDNLLSNRFKIRQFVGMPSIIDSHIHNMTQMLVDEFYKKFGSESERSRIGKAFTVVPLWALSKVTDPSALRSFAFNAKLGIFSVPQFLIQTQSFANIWAISPRSAPAGTVAYLLHTWMRINRHPQVVDAMDRIASNFGWRLGEFAEANRELAKAGYEFVGPEYMLRDQALTTNTVRSNWGSFLDAGQVFFKEGERANRLGSYYTAFREWRHENPTAVITDEIRGDILQKADIFNANMSRASASVLNSSILSLPTQFLSYQIRLGELFLGKRLGGTTAERVAARARLVGMYTLLYGIPTTVGLSMIPDGALPFIGSIRDYAMNHGYTVGDNQLEDLVMNGVPAWAMAMITGEGDYKKGNIYDFGARYGAQGLTLINQSLKSDETVWKLAIGASGRTISKLITGLDPFWEAMKDVTSDSEQGNRFKLTPSDFVNVFDEIASIDSAKRLLTAIHTGRWLGYNEQYVENVSGLDALFRTIANVTSQNEDDIYSLHNIQQQDEDNMRSAEKFIIKDYQRALQAADEKDFATAQTYFTRARARMISAGIPLTRRAQILSRASQNFMTPEIESAVRNWASKNVPAGQEDTRMNAYQRFMQLQNYRNQ